MSSLDRIEATVIAQHRETMRHMLLIHRKLNGRKHFPWAAVAAIGFTATTALLGLLKPETAAAILQALAH